MVSLVTLKTEITDAHKAGQDCKTVAKCFQVAVSSVGDGIKKCQLTGTVEVKLRSGKPRIPSERGACRIDRKAKQSPV